MSTNQQNIPTEIFDWIEQTNFDSLKKSEQEIVLKFFRPEEFDDLHFAAIQLKSFSKKQTDSRSILLNEFDMNYRQQKKYFFLQNSSVLWKAAILLLLLGVGILQLSIINTNNQTNFFSQTIHDTIISVKNIVSDPIKIHDTVLVMSEKSSTHFFKNESKKQIVEKVINEYPVVHVKPDFHVLTILDLQSKPNRQRSGSVKYDSLVKQFQFVTL